MKEMDYRVDMKSNEGAVAGEIVASGRLILCANFVQLSVCLKNSLMIGRVFVLSQQHRESA